MRDVHDIEILKEISEGASYREIADVCGKSLGWVQIQIDRLINENALERKPVRAHRSLTLTRKGREILERAGFPQRG